MSEVAMSGMLQQMQIMAGQAANQPLPSKPDLQPGTPDFGNALKDSLDKVNQLHKAASTQSRDFQAGKPGIDLHNVMIDNQKAGLAFEMTVQVRNRIVAAYKEIMNMQV